MTYGLSNSHVTDGVTWPPKVLWGSTVGYPSDSLAFFTLTEKKTQLSVRDLHKQRAISLRQCISLILIRRLLIHCLSAYNVRKAYLSLFVLSTFGVPSPFRSGGCSMMHFLPPGSECRHQIARREGDSSGLESPVRIGIVLLTVRVATSSPPFWQMTRIPWILSNMVAVVPLWSASSLLHRTALHYASVFRLRFCIVCNHTFRNPKSVVSRCRYVIECENVQPNEINMHFANNA